MASRRDPAGRRRRLSGRPARPGPQADDGPGQPVAPVARRAGRRHDAPLRQRGADGGRAIASPSASAIIEHPLLRRQLMKLIVPTEQALSMAMCAAAVMGEADAGSSEAADVLRILTPLVKFRACRDNIPVATGAMEVRGGNGYIEEWVNAAPGARRPDRRAVGGHQQHQCARRDRPRGRQVKGAQGAGGAAARPAEGGRGPAARPSSAGSRRRSTRALAFAEQVARGAGLRAAGPARRVRALPRGERRAARLGGHARPRPTPAARSSPLRAGASPGAEGPAGARGMRLGRAPPSPLLLDDAPVPLARAAALLA